MKQFFTFLSATLLAAAGISITIAAREASSTNSVAPLSSASSESYLGFDRNVYPGDAAFPKLRQTFAFTSYWLNRPPGEKTNTWMGKRAFLIKSGFGFLVLFRGRDSHEFKKAADGPAKGSLDAEAAAAAAKKEGFPGGTIIFLDLEEGGRLSATYHAYLHAWLDGLAHGGYRAGVYCSGMPAKESGGVTILTADDIRANAGSREYIFFVFNDACPPSPGCVFPGAAPAVALSGVPYAQAWQYAQSPRRKEFTARCATGYKRNGNCYSPYDASHEWDLDADTATSSDPSNSARP
ncbi:MAG TPA: glycoside hydrolase domain-containing protein [Verrucomicrobiae bacterium]|nr:glycoside hydrolase domain-containing protein [Verrucomicrobiae bacterium]